VTHCIWQGGQWCSGTAVQNFAMVPMRYGQHRSSVLVVAVSLTVVLGGTLVETGKFMVGSFFT
jgi:hypothetical protein